MKRTSQDNNERRARRANAAVAILGALIAAAVSPPSAAQDLDLCGCSDMPSLGDYRHADASTYPPGSTRSGAVVTIPLPDDGVLVFDSFHLTASFSGIDAVQFRRNAANTPVTILVKEWFQVDSGTEIRLQGDNAGSGGTSINGRGGRPGPGGYRGGDGGHIDTVGTGAGGEGLGAGGGGHGGAGANQGGHGRFFGTDTALPLTGGSGGGGGGGGTGNCSGGGGGGGGGALLVAANVYIANYGNIFADGGSRGSSPNTACSGYGGYGSGGTVRLVSARTTGSGGIFARGGNGSGSNHGLIRIESFDDSITTSVHSVVPPAIRTRVTSPLVNPIASAVAITEIDGQPVPEPPRGNVGLIDLLVDAPGLITMRVDTVGVPGGTTVEVAVKPEVGGAALRTESTLEPGNCDDAGACFAFATFDLAEGAYFAEAAATYRTP